MSGIIKIGDQNLTISDNKSADVGLASFSGFLGFVGEMSARYGGTPGKIIGLVYAVSGGILTGVFDKNLNPQKEYDNVIGTAMIGFAAGWAGAETGAMIGGSVGGPVGAVVGAVIGAVAAGLWGDDIYDNGEKLVKALADHLEQDFEYLSPTIYGKVTQKEFILKSVANDPDFCKRMFPEKKGTGYLFLPLLPSVDISISSLSPFFYTGGLK